MENIQQGGEDSSFQPESRSIRGKVFPCKETEQESPRSSSGRDTPISISSSRMSTPRAVPVETADSDEEYNGSRYRKLLQQYKSVKSENAALKQDVHLMIETSSQLTQQHRQELKRLEAQTKHEQQHYDNVIKSMKESNSKLKQDQEALQSKYSRVKFEYHRIREQHACMQQAMEEHFSAMSHEIQRLEAQLRQQQSSSKRSVSSSGEASGTASKNGPRDWKQEYYYEKKYRLLKQENLALQTKLKHEEKNDINTFTPKETKPTAAAKKWGVLASAAKSGVLQQKAPRPGSASEYAPSSNSLVSSVISERTSETLPEPPRFSSVVQSVQKQQNPNFRSNPGPPSLGTAETFNSSFGSSDANSLTLSQLMRSQDGGFQYHQNSVRGPQMMNYGRGR